MSETTIATIITLLTSVGSATWVILKVIVPKIVESRLDAERDQREYNQAMGEKELQSAVAQRESNQRLTLTLNQNIMGTLERSMAEATTANEAIRDRFYNRMDKGLDHIFSELDGLRLEIRQMEANYNDLSKERHIYELENHRDLEGKINHLADVLSRVVILLQTKYQIDLLQERKVDDKP